MLVVLSEVVTESCSASLHPARLGCVTATSSTEGRQKVEQLEHQATSVKEISTQPVRVVPKSTPLTPAENTIRMDETVSSQSGQAAAERKYAANECVWDYSSGC